MAINLYSSKVKPKRVFPTNDFIAGMSRYDKGGEGAFAFSRGADYRSNPREITIHPASVKESGGVTQGLPTWMEHVGTLGYVLDNKGNIYSRTSAGSHTLLHTTPNSQGNGLAYYGADDYLYYVNNKSFGRYGPISSSPQTFVDDYLASQGGVPLNTNVLSLVAASSQYAKHIDGAAFDITSDLAMEIYLNPTSLPAVGSSMTLMGKWDESTNHRSYKFDIFGLSGFFGDGSDGSLTISVNTTDTPVDSACTGTVGTQTLSATNASFAAGQQILIIQTQGTGAGTWMRNKIVGYTAGTITLDQPLNAGYVSGAQVIVLKQYTNVTVNTGVTWTAKAWNGTTGGILAFLSNGTVTITGSINADGKGFRGGTHNSFGVNSYGFQGESYVGTGGNTNSANGGGGGGGQSSTGDGSPNHGGGGGGGYGATATAGTNGNSMAGGNAGAINGSNDLTTLNLGSGGGGGGSGQNSNDAGGDGKNGGGIVFLTAVAITITGSISINGVAGTNAQPGDGGGGGGGSGGACFLKCQTATLGTNLIAVNGGSGGSANVGVGGAGAIGRIDINYLTSYTGTTSPVLNAVQDNTLVTTTTYQLRLGISDNGTSFEYLTKNINIGTGTWQGRAAVSWKASTSVATFYLSGVNIGTTTGTKTSISNNVSEFAIGANIGASAYQNFFDGLLDDARLWNRTLSDAEAFANMNVQLGGNESGLKGYWKFNNSLNDATSNANNLTGVNSPTFSTNVPFASPTTRLDIDQSNTASQVGTYTLPTSLTEADQMSFVPARDPQKSLDVDIAAKGTGNWTLTVHNGLNQTVATVTVASANLPTSGFYEFIYSSVFTPVVGATYHFHLNSTVGDGTVNTHVNTDPTTIRFHTYYQFLVNSPYHPAFNVVNVLGIGNGRYFATWDAAAGYNPMRLSFPPQWNVRCVAKWRNMFAIGCWKGTNITDFDQGIIFFWDGFSITYNDFIEVPEGGINAMVGVGDELYFMAGYHGTLMKYDGSTKPKQLRKIPYDDRTTTIDILPGAMTMWNKLVRIGVALSSNNGSIQRGIYSYGNNFDDEVESFSFDHVISTGNYGSSVMVGALMPMNGSLLVGWQDGVANGVDVINPQGNPASLATVEGLVTDFNLRWKEKEGLVARADFKPLRSGESINIKYRFGYGNSWVTGDLTKQKVGDDHIRLIIPNTVGVGRHHEFQIAVDLAQSGNTAPTVLEYGIYEDLMITEDEGDY